MHLYPHRYIEDQKKLTTLPSGVFSGLKAEKTSSIQMYLLKNGLTSLPNGLCQNIIGRENWAGLLRLDIQGNKALSSLEAGTFDGCTIKQFLRFIDNAIARVEPNAFKGLTYGPPQHSATEMYVLIL